MGSMVTNSGGDPAATRLPRAYSLALSGRSALKHRYEEAVTRLKETTHPNVLRSFQTILSKARVGINMSIPKLRRFLEEGRWLNVYEAVAKETGFKGDQLNAEVARRLREFSIPRQKLDKLFRFRKDTHYASLNLGGAGCQRYGICCVIFDVGHWSPFHTCFAGDSIRSSFRRDYFSRVPNGAILESFAIGLDWQLLATIKYEQYLAEQGFCIDPGRLRSMVEDGDTLFEFHLHGSVAREQVAEVVIAPESYDRLCDLLRRAEFSYDPEVMEFDKVGPFRDVMRMLDFYNIPLSISERD